MSVFTSFSMFFVSLFPLWISVIFIDLKSIYSGSSCVWTEILSTSVILIVLLVSGGILKKSFNDKKREGVQRYEVVTAKEEKTITAEFLLSYMLPLFAFDFTQWDGVVLFCIFFAVFAFLCIRHNLFSANVVLELLEYRFYRCNLLNKDKVTISRVIVTRDVLPAMIKWEIEVRPMNNEYSVQVKTKQSDGADRNHHE